MTKKIIAKISEGLGNQLFMYSNAYAIAKKFNINFYIDPYSGYYNKNVRNYMLNNFNISSKTAQSNWIFANNYRNILKKIQIRLDYFKNNKSFLFEKKNLDKSTKYLPINLENTNNEIYIDGNFESEKYFFEYRNQLLSEFTLKNNEIYKQNCYFKMIRDYNVVSISIRQNRFSERIGNIYSKESIIKSDILVKKTVDYIYKSISFFKQKINSPKFLIWSNDFKNLENYFPKNEFTFVQNSKNKELTDFFLLTQCKNFIIGPSTFSWWGAWLSKNSDKICVRPSNINPSNNLDFWPDSWISI